MFMLFSFNTKKAYNHSATLAFTYGYRQVTCYVTSTE